MALKLTKALRAYDRVDVATVDCGNGWLYQIKSFSSVIKNFAREQARIKAAGGVKKQYTSTASAGMTGVAVVDAVDNPWLLGSYEADVEFFVENISVGWGDTLVDDDGNKVHYSKEVALEVFLDTGDVGQQLCRELYAASLDTKLFLKTATAQAEEEGGN